MPDLVLAVSRSHGQWHVARCDTSSNHKSLGIKPKSRCILYGLVCVKSLVLRADHETKDIEFNPAGRTTDVSRMTFSSAIGYGPRSKQIPYYSQRLI